MVATVFFLYSVLIFWLILSKKKEGLGTNHTSLPNISVVIAFRNESSNLSHLVNYLKNQNFPKEKFEVIFIDDHSTDNSETILQEALLASGLRNRVIPLLELTGKKNAIELGVLKSNYEIVITTDADCSIGHNWLKSMSEPFSLQEISMVLGPVKLEGEKSFLNQLQTTEFASLMGITMTTANRGKAILSNGANCAFLKKDFLNSDPYSGNKKTMTGDDIFLLHSLKKKPNTIIEFCDKADALVKSSTKTSLRSFLSQRLRWASKTKNYKDRDTLLIGALLFTVNLSILILLFTTLFGKTALEKLCLVFLFKWVLDLLFLQRVPVWLRSEEIILTSFSLSIVYPFYSVGIALLSLFLKPKWKGRKI